MDYTVFHDFSLITGLNVTIIDCKGDTLFAVHACEEHDKLEELLEAICNDTQQCKVAFLYSSYQAKRFGGQYIFYSPRGLVYLSSPLLNNREMYACVIAGPLLMTDYDEYIEIDIIKKYNPTKKQIAELQKKVRYIPQVSPERVHAMSKQLFLVADYHCDSRRSYMEDQGEKQQLQAHIFDTIQQMKQEASSGGYPLEKEYALLSTVSRGDFNTSRALLNEILGYVLLRSGSDMEILRSRVVELVVLLSRAAMRGGADVESIFGLNYTYLQEIDQLSSFEELTMWLNNIVHRFSQQVFEFADAKHVDLIYRTISYMQQNYMKKLTLEEVANDVYLSPSYLSKIFKEETGYNFNSYLNTIRICESKRLLKDSSIPLVEISSLVGYEDQSYFSKVFKRIEGISPGKYRQMMLKVQT